MRNSIPDIKRKTHPSMRLATYSCVKLRGLGNGQVPLCVPEAISAVVIAILIASTDFLPIPGSPRSFSTDNLFAVTAFRLS